MDSQKLTDLVRARLALISARHEPANKPKHAIKELRENISKNSEEAEKDYFSQKRFNKQHIWAIVAVLVVATIVTVLMFYRSRQTVISETVKVSAQAYVSEKSIPSISPTKKIMVHVIGAVVHPGVIEVKAGSRVFYAISAAGGLRNDADTGQLNLATIIHDGDQIVVGTKNHPKGEVKNDHKIVGGAGQLAKKVNLNSANQAELETLPGIGPATAKSIIDWRSKHRKFTRIEQLQEIDGIGPKTFAKLSGLLDV